MGRAENIDLAQAVYAALEKDDISGVLDLCAPDAEWRYPAEGSLPYGGIWRGRDAMRFFDAHDAAEEILDFQPAEFVADGDQVVVFGFFRGRAKPTGRTWETRFVHAITINASQVQRFEAYFDTAAAVQAHRE